MRNLFRALSLLLALVATVQTAAAQSLPAKSAFMNIPGARLIPAEEARRLVAPWFAKHHKGADLEGTLDEALMLSGAHAGAVLTLPHGASVDGNLVLEWESASFEDKRFRGIVALGRLTIKGDIRNDNWDGGPFLVALGPLTAGNILKRGAPIVAFGSLDCRGIIYGEYNHGMFRALGGVRAQGIVMDDHDHELAAPVDAPVAVLDAGFGYPIEPQEILLPEFFDEEDDYGRVYPVDDFNVVLRQRILAGKPVIRADAPRGKP